LRPFHIEAIIDSSMTIQGSSSTTADDAELLCPACDYPLRGLEGDRCPECGTAFDRTALNVSQIPWVYRGQIGMVRAFWRTVWIAVFKPRRIALDVARPVNLSDGRRFRHIVVLFAYVPLLSAGLWALIEGYVGRIPALKEMRGHVLGWGLEAGAVVVAAFSLWLFLFAATGVAGYFLHPASISLSRQNRAAALSDYACASLVFTPLPLITLLLMWLLDRPDMTSHGSPLMLFMTILGFFVVLCPIFQLLAWHRSSVILLRRTTHCTGARAAAMAAFLPVAWVALFALIGVGIPAAYMFISFVILSFN